MPNKTIQEHNYQVGKINFVVTPVYRPEPGESIFSILLKLIKADIERN